MNAREIAYQCIYDILVGQQYGNLRLKQVESDNMSFITQVVYGTLRNYRLVRYYWSQFVQKQPDKKTCTLLDMATYELVLMESQDYGCVNECVEIAKKIKGGSQVKLVNAVLRKVAGRQFVQPESLAVETSHPDWLINMWKSHYGAEKTEEICRMDLKEARTALRVNTLLTSREELLKDDHFTAGTIDNCLYYNGNILATDYFRNGKIIIQSESSQLAGNSMQAKKGERILDMCAAPGSKSIQMAMSMENQGELICCDLHPQRVALIENNANRFGISCVKAMCKDSTSLDFEPFDGVLLDAPCSGLGVLRHKPDIKSRIQPKDIDDIVALQAQLLESADKMLKPNGRLVYSTCTLNRKENEKQIEQFVAQHPNYHVVSSTTVFPMDYDSDGFYIAKLIKSVIE